MDRSSDPNMKMARASAFFENLAAKLSSSLGELRLLSISRYKDRTRPRLAVHEIVPNASQPYSSFSNGQLKCHGSHATLGLYKKLLHRAPNALNRWEMCAQPKVVLKIESEEDMLVLQERAKSLELPTHITIDAGRTQIAPNSRTVMAILGPVEVVDEVTGGLKLL
ncbi:peptidyl-tRNA hydrolase 2, mitochondrial-like [Pistacia vera]|uniref:peptidyl-tRNA hydrolase 2, mitochondrial-like n=1 Tax=Pistacia vera TaxID=55513 RepID=UPI0012637920|nr:peptidyl-tRNA hydrolase 2, mitochondrial-like [Pistacia vera]